MLFRLFIGLMIIALTPLGAGATVAGNSLIEQQDSSDLDRIKIDLEKSDNIRRQAILEAKQDLIDSGNSRLEIIIGGFGVTIAFVAIIFGFATREAAIAAATRGIEQVRAQMEQSLAQIRSQQEEIDRLSESIRARHIEMEKQAAKIFDQLIRTCIDFPVGELSLACLIWIELRYYRFKKKLRIIPFLAGRIVIIG